MDGNSISPDSVNHRSKYGGKIFQKVPESKNMNLIHILATIYIVFILYL